MSTRASDLLTPSTSRTARAGVVGLDVRESSALDVLGLVRSRRAEVAFADSFVARLDAPEWSGATPLEPIELTPAALAAADCVVIVTEQSRFDYEAIVAHGPLVVDTRHAVETAAPHVLRLGTPGPVRAFSDTSAPVHAG